MAKDFPMPGQGNATPAPTGATPFMPGGNDANLTFELDLPEEDVDRFCVPDGDYHAVCVDVVQGVSKSNNPQFIWTFQIADGEHKGREFKNFTALTPAAMWKVTEVAQALGIGKPGQRVKFTRNDAVGKHCIITMEQTEYNGQNRSSIVKVVKK